MKAELIPIVLEKLQTLADEYNVRYSSGKWQVEKRPYASVEVNEDGDATDVTITFNNDCTVSGLYLTPISKLAEALNLIWFMSTSMGCPRIVVY